MTRHHRILPAGSLQTALRTLQDRADAARVAPGTGALVTRSARQTFIRVRRRQAQVVEEQTGGGPATWS